MKKTNLLIAHKNLFKNETLQEHIDATFAVYENMKEKYELNKYFDNIFKYLNLSKIEISFVNEMIDDMIKSHDYGKVNHKFQEMITNKEIYKSDYISNRNHSFLSSIMFCDEQFSKSNYVDTVAINGLILIFAFIISNHHSFTNDIKKFKTKFVMDNPDNPDHNNYKKYITENYFKEYFIFENKFMNSKK